MKNKVFAGESWTIEDLHNFWEVIDNIGKDWGITYPKTQIEILSSSQMVETIATIGSPCSYDHWSIGKSAINLQAEYDKGHSGLALELIINSDPTIMYISENNTLIQQGLVLAHAGIGHGSVFKHNYLFKQWTDATSILDYLSFSRKYISECEMKYGPRPVEEMLDMCHALQDFGVSQHKRKRLKDYKVKQEILQEEQQAVGIRQIDKKYKSKINTSLNKLTTGIEDKVIMEFPEENILYFIEKYSTNLRPWHREILRINRKIAEYFYPQRKTKFLHEGWATFIQYMTFDELLKRGHITEGGYLEFLRNHVNVIYQPGASHNFTYSGTMNPYAIGFAIFEDLYRMTISPTKEDLKEYPEICNTDWKISLMEIVKNYSDADFVSRYLTSRVISKYKLFTVESDYKSERISITNTANSIDNIREIFAAQRTIGYHSPIVSIAGYEDEVLQLSIESTPGHIPDYKSMEEICHYIHILWGDAVSITDK
jgi:stage V sporulation protein R